MKIIKRKKQYQKRKIKFTFKIPFWIQLNLKLFGMLMTFLKSFKQNQFIFYSIDLLNKQTILCCQEQKKWVEGSLKVTKNADLPLEY